MKQVKNWGLLTSGAAVCLMAYALLCTCISSAQGITQNRLFSAGQINNVWTSYTDLNHIRSLAWEGDYLWVGTEGGVVQRNGLDASYTIYTNADGLQGHGIEHIAIDGQGNKWFDTTAGSVSNNTVHSYGVLQYDGSVWTQYANWPDSPEAGNITGFAVDFSGTLWAGSHQGGAYYFRDDAWHIFTLDDGLPSNNVLAMTVDGLGNLWFATDAGLAARTADAINIYAYTNDARAIATDDSSVWVATPNGVGRMSVTSGAYSLQTTADGLGTNDIYSILVDWNGQIWAGSDQGVSLFSQGAWTNYTSVNGVDLEEVSALSLDKRGHIWVGSSAGLFEYEDGFWTSHLIPGPADNRISALFVNNAQQLWAGTGESDDPKGLSYFDGNGWQTYTVQHGLPNDHITAISSNSDGNVWIGTGEGLAEYVEGIWHTRMLPTAGQDVQVLIHDPSADRLWVGTGQGAATFDGAEWDLFTYNSGLISENITAIAIDEDGAVWFGTDAGVSRMKDDEWTSYTKDDGLLSNQVTALTVDAHNRIWVGTPKGINRFDDDRWVLFTKNNSPLIDNKIQALTTGPDGSVWIGTQAGAHQIKEDVWLEYTILDGLADDDIISIISADETHTWFGTSRGISQLQHRDQEPTPTLSPTATPNSTSTPTNTPSPTPTLVATATPTPGDLNIALPIIRVSTR